MKTFVIAGLLISCAIAQQQQQQQQQAIPPFLIGAPPRVVDEFQRLLSTAAQRTDSDMERAIEDWISKQNQGIQRSFQQFKQQAINALQQAEAQHQMAVAKLSPEAKKADMELSAIAKNSALTPMQKQQQIDVIIRTLPENVKQELQRAAQG